MARKQEKTAKEPAKAAPSAEPAGLIPAKFRDRYREHGGSCGDDLAAQISQYAKTDGKSDPAKLRRLAEANGVWRDRYAALNPGQARMNVGNRLRALVRHGKQLVWP